MSAPLAGDWGSLRVAQQALDCETDSLVAALYSLRSYQMDNNQVDDATVDVLRRAVSRRHSRFSDCSRMVSDIKQVMAQLHQARSE